MFRPDPEDSKQDLPRQRPDDGERIVQRLERVPTQPDRRRAPGSIAYCKSASPLKDEFPFFDKTRASHWPVCDFLLRAIASGVPVATISPPRAPPSGPRSITQSAALITSRLCSITIKEPPASMRRRKAASSLLTSSKCRPVVGSSNRYNARRAAHWRDLEPFSDSLSR